MSTKRKKKIMMWAKRGENESERKGRERSSEKKDLFVNISRRLQNRYFAGPWAERLENLGR